MAYRGALLLLCASLAAGRAPLAARRAQQPRRRLRALAANGSGAAGAAGKPRATWNNCSCLKEWNEPGLGSCSNYCCNPNDDATDWCMVKDEECEGEDWGFCRPTQPIRPGCHDLPLGWTDADGAPCSDYYVYQWCNSTGGYGSGWGSDWGPFSSYANHGVPATSACCACGGGSTGGNASATPQVCFDRPGWADSDGDGCEDYEQMHWCNSTGGFGFGWHDWGPFPGQPNASVACCACGGGRHEGAAGAAGPTAPPTATAAPATGAPASSSTASASTAAPAAAAATAAPTAAATAAPGTTASATQRRFTWNGCLCRQEWEGEMLQGSLVRGVCRSYCCPLGDPQGDWCVVEDPACEDQQWGYCRPPSQGAASCTNSPSTWQDSQGNNCDAYQYMGWCTAEGGYGAKWRAEWGRFEDYAGQDGRTALGACCRCGGGERGAGGAPGGAALQCVDKANWHDNDGDTCDVYAEKNWCTSEGGYGLGWYSEWGTFEYYSGQFTAAAACCACGGGSLAGVQQPSAPSPGAAAPPAETGSLSSKGTMVGLAAAVLVGAGVGIYCFRAKAAGKTGGRNLQIGSTQLGRKYQSADGL